MLRQRMAAMTGTDGLAAASQQVYEPEVVRLPKMLAGCFPGGGLLRRSASHMSDCALLAVELIARVTRVGGFVAVVGWPELMFAGVIDSGGDVSKVVAIPDPGGSGLAVATVLAEGMDLVLYRSASPQHVTPTNARPLLAKIRGGTAALVLVGANIPSPHAHIDAHVQRIHGLSCGGGRIRGVDLAVTVRTKMSAQPQRVTLQVG